MAEGFEPWLSRWGLEPDGAALVTASSRLLPVRRGNEAAMLKIAAHAEERRGAALMAWYAGDGAARVLAHEGEAILLERATGPRSLERMARGGEDDQASRILCETIGCLHAPRGVPAPEGLTPLPVWFRSLGPAAARHGAVLADALAAARELLDSPRNEVVLHGDIHHDNVLDGGAHGWLAIDPKGALGERGYEYANILLNPDIGTAAATGRLARQTGLIAGAAGLEPARLMQWTLARAGLSAAWLIEDGLDPAPTLRIAQIAAAELATLSPGRPLL